MNLGRWDGWFVFKTTGKGERRESTYCTGHVYKICMETGGSDTVRWVFVLVIVRSQNVSNNVSIEKIECTNKQDKGLPQPVLIIVCGIIEHNPTCPFGDVYWQTGYIITLLCKVIARSFLHKFVKSNMTNMLSHGLLYGLLLLCDDVSSALSCIVVK